jgi:hypothetical protein
MERGALGGAAADVTLEDSESDFGITIAVQ